MRVKAKKGPATNPDLAAKVDAMSFAIAAIAIELRRISGFELETELADEANRAAGRARTGRMEGALADLQTVVLQGMTASAGTPLDRGG